MSKQIILDKIKAYQRIMLFRHIRIDGDCVGASKGLKELILTTWPDKEVLIIDDEHSDYLAFLGPDDAPVEPQYYADALGIVVDTATADRISNRKYALCRELIKIDHHIERDPYGDVCWVEEQRSSACEMIADFYAAFRDELVLTPRAATYIYTGMVTDSGRFQYDGVTGETLRLASLMLDAGVDTQRLYAHLYLRSFDSLKFKAYIYETMHITRGGVAYVCISQEVQNRFGLSFEDACAAIGYLDGIRDCLCWLAFIESGETQTIRVRLRSRFVPISGLAERYRGGGHAFASGATIYNENEMQSLISEADALVKHYKETNEGWL